jgi:recombination protein RecA
VDLDLLIAEMIADLPREPIMDYDRVERIPSGSIALDHAISGGWPRGRWSLLWGEEGAGKSTVTFFSAAAVLKSNPGASVAYIDTEGGLDGTYLDKFNIDRSRFVVWRPDTTEETWNLARALIKKNLFWIIILDSVGMMTSALEKSGNIGDDTVAINARLNKDFFTRTTNELTLAKTLDVSTGEIMPLPPVFLMTNHITKKIGVMYGSPDNMPGGTKLRNALSVIIKLKKPIEADYRFSGEQLIAINHSGVVTKCKVGPPKRELEFTVRQDAYSGIDNVPAYIDLAIKAGLFQNSRGKPYKNMKSDPWLNGEAIPIGGITVTKDVKSPKPVTKQKLELLLYMDDLWYNRVKDLVERYVYNGNISETQQSDTEGSDSSDVQGWSDAEHEAAERDPGLQS